MAIAKDLLALCAKNDIILEVEAGVVGGEEDGVNNEGAPAAKLYTTPEDMVAVHEALSGIGGRFMFAATFGNVHGVYQPGHVDLLGSKRRWIVALQFAIGAAFALVALTLPASRFLQMTLATFWLMAFASATHDIAADGYYLLGLPERQQAAFVGVRSTFYRIAMIAAKGILVVLAGTLEQRGFSVATAWSVTFFLLAAIMLALFLYHLFVLP